MAGDHRVAVMQMDGDTEPSSIPTSCPASRWAPGMCEPMNSGPPITRSRPASQAQRSGRLFAPIVELAEVAILVAASGRSAALGGHGGKVPL